MDIKSQLDAMARRGKPTREKSTEALLTDVEVAALLDVSVKTVRRWRLLGRGPSYLKIHALVRYERATVEAWMRNNPR